MNQLIEIHTTNADNEIKISLRYQKRRMTVNVQKNIMPKHIDQVIKSAAHRLILGMHEEEVEKLIRMKLAKMALLDQIKL